MKKKSILIVPLCLLSLAISSCDDFLTVQEKGRTTIPNFLSDPDGLYAGLVGAYNKMYAYYDTEFGKYAEVAGNMVSMKMTDEAADMVSQYNYTSDPQQETGAVGYVWRKIYEAQSNVNNVLQYQPKVVAAYPTAKDRCTQIRGEALLLRAMCHFDQCRVYAQAYNYTADASHLGVPILTITPGPDDNVNRKSVKAVYNQILADLKEASECLASVAYKDRFHASLQAVNAMYSRVFLYMEDWDNALKYARLAIGSETLAQGEAYTGMYQNLSVKGEAIMRFSGQDLNGKLKTFYDASCVPADTLLSLFDAGDIRLTLLKRGTTAYCSKYAAKSTPDNQTSRNDPMVFRLSEMYLNAAEAACNLKDMTTAKYYIRAILERAINADYADRVLNQYTDATLSTLIEKERVKELCFEGHNFFDITRRKQNLVREAKTNSSVKRMDYPSDYFVLPIPQVELNANLNMQPNPTVNK